MHQALYRKWRPRTFEDVCGQDHVTSVLRYEIAQGAPSHAYLFCGSRGTGKTTCAKILAKAVNCLEPQNGSPCGKCAACLSIDNGSATDVLEMDAASNNGVENIRDIRDEVVYTPSSLKYRVYIVDEVHMLSTSAFNALLKTLEEPPSHVIFILATTELHKLPATIVSRCQRFDFRRIATPVLAARVSYIAEREGITLLPEAADRIARIAQGGMRDAISLLELCAGGGRTIDLATVNEMTGSGGREETLRVLRALLAADYDSLFAMIDEAVNASRDLKVFWQDLISLYRDLLVVKTTDNAARYLDLTEVEIAELTDVAAGMGKATLLSHCRLLENALAGMEKSNAANRIIAEMTLVRMCDGRLDTSPEGLLARIEKLEEALATGTVPVAASPVEVPPPKPAKKAENTPRPATYSDKKAEAAPQNKPEGRTLSRMRGFVNCVERVSRENSMLASFLGDVKAFTDEAGRVILRLPNSFAGMMIEQCGGRDLLRRALSAERGKELADGDLVFEVADEKADARDTVLDDILAAAEEK